MSPKEPHAITIHILDFESLIVSLNMKSNDIILFISLWDDILSYLTKDSTMLITFKGVTNVFLSSPILDPICAKSARKKPAYSFCNDASAIDKNKLSRAEAERRSMNRYVSRIAMLIDFRVKNYENSIYCKRKRFHRWNVFYLKLS